MGTSGSANNRIIGTGLTSPAIEPQNSANLYIEIYPYPANTKKPKTSFKSRDIGLFPTAPVIIKVVSFAKKPALKIANKKSPINNSSAI